MAQVAFCSLNLEYVLESNKNLVSLVRLAKSSLSKRGES